MMRLAISIFMLLLAACSATAPQNPHRRHDSGGSSRARPPQTDKQKARLEELHKQLRESQQKLEEFEQEISD